MLLMAQCHLSLSLSTYSNKSSATTSLSFATAFSVLFSLLTAVILPCRLRRNHTKRQTLDEFKTSTCVWFSTQTLPLFPSSLLHSALVSTSCLPEGFMRFRRRFGSLIARQIMNRPVYGNLGEIDYFRRSSRSMPLAISHGARDEARSYPFGPRGSGGSSGPDCEGDKNGSQPRRRIAVAVSNLHHCLPT